MTTAEQVMPTLRDIEQGLRARLAELTAVQTTEREQREAARAKVEKVAQDAASNNSIGQVADDLLEELGLHGRPRDVGVVLSIEHRQTVPPHQVRDTYFGGAQAFGAYQNLTQADLFTTMNINLSVSVPRDHEGCACDIPVTDAMIEAHVGRLPAGVERVDTTIEWCGFNGYPYTDNADMESKCRNYRALRAQQKADAHDSPLVQKCEFNHEYIEPHRHVFYRNGDVTYSVQADYEPYPPTVVVPGWYGVGAQVGQRIPGSPPEYNPNDPYRLLQCNESGHPLSATHLHWHHTEDDRLTYTRDLDYITDNATRIPGLFTRDGSRVGNLHE